MRGAYHHKALGIFLEQSKESKMLGHKRNKPDKVCFEGLISRTQGFGSFEGRYLENIRSIEAIWVERGFASREH